MLNGIYSNNGELIELKRLKSYGMFPMDSVFTQEVIICTKKRRGDGKDGGDPIRIITEVFTKEGNLIAEYDPLIKSQQEIEYESEFIDFEGYRYWYQHKLAVDRTSICLATKDPKQYCNGLYLYSTKDPGDGMAFVVVKTDNPEYSERLTSTF